MVDEIGHKCSKSPVIAAVLSRGKVLVKKPIYFQIIHTLKRLRRGMVACEKRCTKRVSSSRLA